MKKKLAIIPTQPTKRAPDPFLHLKRYQTKWCFSSPNFSHAFWT